MRKRISRFAIVLAIIALVSTVGAIPAFAKTKTYAVSAAQIKKAKCLTFDGSPYSRGFIDGRYSDYNFGSFQNFCYTPDKKHVFATTIGTKGNSYSTGLVCYRVNGKTAEFRDGTLLKNYGHSDVLAVTQPDKTKERYYVWVSKCKSKKQTYGTVIERLTFAFEAEPNTAATNENDVPVGTIPADTATAGDVVSDGAGATASRVKAKVSEKIEIKNFQNACVVMNSGKRVAAKMEYGSPERVTAAANQTDNRIAFRLKFPTGYGCSYVMYDLKKLSGALDKAVAAGKKSYDMKLAKDFQVANIYCNLVPLDGFQSFDIDKKYIYVCGHTRSNVKYQAGIYKIKYKNTIEEADLRDPKNIAQYIKLQVKNEIEGIKIQKKGKKILYYFNTRPYESGLLRWGQIVYKVAR